MDSKLATVEVTDPKYRVLKHEPTKAGFDADGRSLWPLDQFTHRLVIEGSVRIVPAEEAKPVDGAPMVQAAPVDAEPHAPADASASLEH